MLEIRKLFWNYYEFYSLVHCLKLLKNIEDILQNIIFVYVYIYTHTYISTYIYINIDIYIYINIYKSTKIFYYFSE